MRIRDLLNAFAAHQEIPVSTLPARLRWPPAALEFLGPYPCPDPASPAFSADVAALAAAVGEDPWKLEYLLEHIFATLERGGRDAVSPMSHWVGRKRRPWIPPVTAGTRRLPAVGAKETAS